MVIVRLLLFFMLFQTYMLDAYANEAEYVDLNSQACEKVMSGESKSSTRLRASDKAVFLAVKKLDQLSELEKTLSDHDLNVLIYRFVDEYIEDLSIKTTEDTADKVCVDVTGRILLNNIQSVKEEYTINHTNPDIKKHEVKQIIEEVKQELKIKPDNPESLALVHVKQLEYFNGTKSLKYANLLKQNIDGNPYFYLTEDSEIADYIITPKILKAKVDALDASNKRLHMALVLEITGLEKEIVSEYQNRFVLFGAEENDQKIASRLISKLIEQAGLGAVRKIEHKEQRKLENKVLGRTLN